MPDASQHSDDANVYVDVFQVIDADKPTFTTKRRRYQVGDRRIANTDEGNCMKGACPCHVTSEMILASSLAMEYATDSM